MGRRLQGEPFIDAAESVEVEDGFCLCHVVEQWQDDVVVIGLLDDAVVGPGYFNKAVGDGCVDAVDFGRQTAVCDDGTGVVDFRVVAIGENGVFDVGRKSGVVFALENGIVLEAGLDVWQQGFEEFADGDEPFPLRLLLSR